MADLKSLNERITAARVQQKAPKKKKRAPRVDRSVERAVKTMSESVQGALTIGFKKLEAILQKIEKRPEQAQISKETIRQAVAEELSSFEPQKIEFPDYEPVSYRATIEHRGNKMIGAVIKPITD